MYMHVAVCIPLTRMLLVVQCGAGTYFSPPPPPPLEELRRASQLREGSSPEAPDYSNYYTYLEDPTHASEWVSGQNCHKV